MFGGWGPHLGHLVRAGIGAQDHLWFVDDACSQGAAADACDVNVDKAIAYYRLDPGGWTKVLETPLPGTIQQNTGTIASKDGAKLFTYGVDVAGHAVIECAFDVATATSQCNALSGIAALPAGTNYLGAAVSPLGDKMVWFTRVQDGGNGDFSFLVDYGGGWNGPRTGPIGGYNDASYIDVAFGAGGDPNKFTMHGQLVSGLAPNWSFFGAVGDGDLSKDAPVVWSLALAPPMGDTIESTNDVWIDPDTADEHLIARSHAGAAVYYHRAKGGAWSGPLFTLPSSYRVRFVVAAGSLWMVYGVAKQGMALRGASKAARAAGKPIDWASLAETMVALPAGYEDLYAIYPESPTYEVASPADVNVAVVGAGKQNEALSVTFAP